MLTRALSWSAAGALAGMLVQLLLMAVLSRLLGALEFGLMASAALALRFVSYFAQFGMGPALIQRAQVEPGHHSAAWLAALGIGLVCWVAFWPLAPLASTYFREPQLLPVLRVLPAALALGALASVPQALLRRALRFKALALADLGALVLGYGGAGVTLALAGWGVWALVAAVLAQQAVALALASWVARPALARPHRRHFAALAGYGGRYSLVGFLDFLSSNVETLFIGRVLGTPRLGEFNRAQAITTLPVDQLMGSISRVMFPALSALREDKAALARSLLLALNLSALLTFSLAGCLWAASTDLVALGLGAKWEATAPLAAALAWSIPAVYLSTFIGVTFDTLARFRRKTVLILAVTAAKLLLMALLAGQGLQAVVWALVGAEWLRVLLGLLLLRPLLGLPLAALAAALGQAGALGALVAVSAWGLRALLPVGSPPVLGLALAAAVAAVLVLGPGRALLRRVVQKAEASGHDLKTLRRLTRL